MAKATITIEDVEGKENAININYDFFPEIPTAEENTEEVDNAKLTPAQSLAMHIYDLIQLSVAKINEAQEETCEQTEEGTCCGGDCHPTTEG